MKSHIYLILVFLIVSSSLKSQISHKVSFTEKELTFEKVLGENKQEYMKVNYSGLSSQGVEGTPELPMKYIKVRVPVMANNISITIEKISKQNIPLSTRIYPAQPGVPMSSLQPISFVDCDPAVYGSYTGFPKEIVSIVDNGYLLGNIHIIDLAISPIVYYPNENRLELNSEISFRINYSVSEMASTNEGMRVINRISGNDEEFDLNNLVVNPDFKESAHNTGSSVSSRSISSASSISLPFYEYVVITNNALKPSFNQLVSWKRTKGYKAGVVTMEEILDDDGITGDTTATYALNDSAGKLRQYLFYAFERGTKYVFLGGVGSIVPIRYGTATTNTWTYASMLNAGKVPTDLYYCDLTGNWKLDNDDFLGERVGDHVDFKPELFVGRILCEDPEEVANYTYKLMKYERNPGNGDYSYLQKAFCTQADEMQDLDYAVKVAAKLDPIFPNPVTFEETGGSNTSSLPSFPTGDDVISEMNEGYGFVNLIGHGSPCTITVSSQGYNEDYYNLLLSTSNTSWPTTSNTFDNLTNFNKPSVVYTQSCETMPYDKLEILNVSYDINMGQAFTTAGKFGGPIYLGSTRITFSPSNLLNISFIDNLSNYSNIGICEAMSRLALNKSEFFNFFTGISHNLLGCPELELWTGIPKTMSNITIDPNLYPNLTVDVPDTICNQPKICVSGLFGGASYHSYDSCSNHASFSLPSNCKNYTISVTKHNYIPYVAPLYLQNESVSGTHYVHTSDVHIGSNVTSEKQTGNFTITSSADVTIDPIGEVTLDAGFGVDLGGKFEIKTNQ